MIEVLAASINWVDLFHYPHVGNPLPGQYSGPPVLFVLLDFAVFLYLAYRFVIKPMGRMAQEQNNLFRRDVDEAVLLEEHAARIQENTAQLERELPEKKIEVESRMQQELQIERELIFQKAEEYNSMRKMETLKQISIKRELMVHRIREEVLAGAIAAFQEEVRTAINPEKYPALFQKGLDSTFQEGISRES